MLPSVLMTDCTYEVRRYFARRRARAPRLAGAKLRPTLVPRRSARDGAWGARRPRGGRVARLSAGATETLRGPPPEVGGRPATSLLAVPISCGEGGWDVDGSANSPRAMPRLGRQRANLPARGRPRCRCGCRESATASATRRDGRMEALTTKAMRPGRTRGYVGRRVHGGGIPQKPRSGYATLRTQTRSCGHTSSAPQARPQDPGTVRSGHDSRGQFGMQTPEGGHPVLPTWSHGVSTRHRA